MEKTTSVWIAVLCAAVVAVAAIAFAMAGPGSDSGSGGNDSSDSTDYEDYDEVTTEYTITYDVGSECHTVSVVDGETIITFSGATEDIECTITGELKGSIVVDIGDSYDFKLTLAGVTIASSNNAPIAIISADDATIAAKNGTENAVYDYRAEVTDDSAISSAIYSKTDLDIQGRGTLTVYSENNNGIHSKDDLDVKNLTLTVDCEDNALKGNDSVTIQSGVITLTARSGDAIKTSNTDATTKDDGTIRQEGIVTICTDKGDLTLTIKAESDGIDASYDVIIEETEGTLTLNIKTGTYAGYSASTAASSTIGADVSAPGQPGGGQQPGGNPGGQGGQDQQPGGGQQPGTNPGGEGSGGYSGSESRKGIKGDNSVTILGGTITISSDDDGVHSNGSVTISGGTITIACGDDGMHADGALAVTGGTITITECYEGLEGNTVDIEDGDISIVSSDDGINSTSTSGVGITVAGGQILIRAGGDGLDSNSYTQYKGIVISGGDMTVISTGNADSALDTENGYTYTGGRVLAISVSGGMAQGECTNCSNFSSVAKSGTVSASSGSYITVSVGGSTVSAVKMTSSMSAFVVYLGSSSATISTASSVSGADSDGVYWS